MKEKKDRKRKEIRYWYYYIGKDDVPVWESCSGAFPDHKAAAAWYEKHGKGIQENLNKIYHDKVKLKVR